MKVRIKSVPLEREIDGVRLDRFERGSICEVSASVGAWLITQGYADAEMRRSPYDYQRFNGIKDPASTAHDHPRRRRTDR